MQDSLEKSAYPRKRRRQARLLPLVLVLVAIGAGLWVYQQFFRPMREAEPAVGSVQMTGEQAGSAKATGDRPAQYDLSPAQSPADTQQPEATPGGAAGVVGSAAAPLQAITEQSPAASQGLAPPDIQAARQRLEQFYLQLDAQPFIAEARLGMPSREYLAKQIQKMIDTPPLVSGETDDLFNVLRNTAHFFRIAGKDNIDLLKRIIVSERPLQEQLLADCYLLAMQPELMQSASGISLNKDALYEYAGFFLTTMGGRLYLYRRDSGLRMLVNYYSILLVDKANAEGRNRHGIDLSPPVAQLIDEMENGGGQLLGREGYLDTLYQLQGKYLPGR